MEPLPEFVEASPDRGLIGFCGDHVENHDIDLHQADESGVLESDGRENYLRTEQTLAPVTLVFTGSEPAMTGLEMLGRTVLDIPTGRVIVDEITIGVQGPFVLPEGPGSYRLTIHGDPCRIRRAAEVVDRMLDEDVEGPLLAREDGENLERYHVRLERIGDAVETVVEEELEDPL